jgi:hypothetical protein
LGDSRRGDRGRRHPNARRFEEFPSFHVILLSALGLVSLDTVAEIARRLAPLIF